MRTWGSQWSHFPLLLLQVLRWLCESLCFIAQSSAMSLRQLFESILFIVYSCFLRRSNIVGIRFQH
jgi:hypothetical protein